MGSVSPQLCLRRPLPHKDARSPYTLGRRRWSGLGALCPLPLASRPPAVPTTQGSSILLLPWDSLMPLLCPGAPLRSGRTT